MIERRTFGPFNHGISRPFTRADLEVYGINTFRPSYTVHVFFDDPKMENPKEPEKHPGYAGRFSVFGHPQCVGDDMHCHVDVTARRFDDRPSHPLTPAFRRVIVTDALRTAITGGRRITVTLLASTTASKSDIEGDHLLEISGLQLVTFE